MGFELGLKAFIRHHGATEKEVFNLGHRLIDTLNEAESRGLKPIDAARLRACLTVLAEQHLDHSYRYLPIGTVLRTPRIVDTLAVLADLMTVLLNSIGRSIEFSAGGK